ncbi:hypothetical protein EYR40_003003 [Pleurotus pulmonarius]|nr:hypothetical protein EYR36_005452 [Pleurotus pulmonarius]KAF4580605.1 hypothetical protein EYR40_003003 [Pleurotus pulmonarius]KAF4580715.1 hypothetical protein EYR38_003001 [Pleurotus pulmonarius]
MRSAPPDGFSLKSLPRRWNASELFKNIDELHFVAFEDIQREITIYDIRTHSIRKVNRRLNNSFNYCDVVLKLRHDIHHIAPLNEDYIVFYRLREAMIQPYKNESERKTAFNNVAMEFLGHRPGGWTIGEYHTDSALLVQIPPRNFPYVIEEVKKEIGSSVAEPGLQSALYYLEYLRQMVVDGDYSHCAFPIILLLQFGPHLSVLVGTAAGPEGQPAAEQIACIALPAHQANQKEVETGNGTQPLFKTQDSKSSSLIHAPSPIRMAAKWLLPTSLASLGNVSITPDATTRRHEPGPIFIKFSLQYSQDAHEATFNAGYAPELLAVKNVGDWFMIVMDDVSGEYTTLEALKEQGGVDLAAIRDHMQKGLDILHKEYVHGDVRAGNFLVRNTDVGDGARLGERSLLLVDWDWAGRIGEARYPHNINPEIARSEGATAGAEIQPAHDIWMLNAATGLMLRNGPS